MNTNYNLVRMNNFAAWLARHRKKQGLLQSEVAKRAGVSTSYISTLERGQKHSITGAELTPERNKVIAIAKALNADVNEALTLCGYAAIEQSKGLIIPPYPKKPRNVAEFLEVLGSLGQFSFAFDKAALDQYTEEDFEALLERIAADVEITIRRKQK